MRENRASIFAGLAAGIVLIAIFVTFEPMSPYAKFSIASNAILIGDKEISPNRRMDTNQSNLTSIEQKAIKIALSNQDISKILVQKEDLYIERITLGDHNDFEVCDGSSCAHIIIAWTKPEIESLDIVVDLESQSVKQWLLESPSLSSG